MSEATPTTPRVRIRRVIDAPPADVFEAWTDPEGMRHWMRPGSITDAECELDVREGGGFRIVMIAQEGDRLEHTGEYRVVDPPHKLVFTWISGGTDGRESLVTVELFERGERTELVLTHEKVPDERRAEMHTDGWTTIVDRLADQITRTPADGSGG
ncbi:MAG: SRPBCC family protein [Gemmatimonadota bacterium]